VLVGLVKLRMKGEKARLSFEEFERIIEAYHGELHRKKIAAWLAAESKSSVKGNVKFDGAISKHLRIKSGHSLIRVARYIGKSKSYLSNLENGRKTISPDIKRELLTVYGYRESSFKNFSPKNERSRAIPARYKLHTLMKSMSEDAHFRILEFALALSNQLHSDHKGLECRQLKEGVEFV
jgi:transcriptional regulator with XRE-family HTH domain